MMGSISKDKIFGIVATLLFHVLLLCLLCILVMAAPPRQDESGVSVVMGNVNNAFGRDVVMTDVKVIAQKATPQKSSYRPKGDESLMTQDVEKSVAMPVKESKSAREIEAERRAAEEAERRRIEKEAEAKADNLISGAFGKGKTMVSKGRLGDDAGVQGSKDGNSDTGKTSGNGGFGEVDLKGRSLSKAGLPLPEYNVQEEGKVVVVITVDPKGRVVQTSISPRTNTTSLALRKAAEEAAKKAIFNSIPGAKNQEGTITYYFKLR